MYILYGVLSAFVCLFFFKLAAKVATQSFRDFLFGSNATRGDISTETKKKLLLGKEEPKRDISKKLDIVQGGSGLEEGDAGDDNDDLLLSFQQEGTM